MATIVYLISSNVIPIQKGKVREIEQIIGSVFSAHNVELTTLSLDLPEIQGTSDQIVIDKLNRARQVAPGPVIVEDTSLCFNALSGLPGPYM